MLTFHVGDLLLINDGTELVLLWHLVALHLSKLFLVERLWLILLVLLILRVHLVEWHESSWKLGRR